jgi:hypothetical protein
VKGIITFFNPEADFHAAAEKLLVDYAGLAGPVAALLCYTEIRQYIFHKTRG